MANEHNLLIPKQKMMDLQKHEVRGGIEHYTFRVGNRFYKLTKPTGWGLMGNPENYLKSIAAFSKVAPQLDTKVEGVFMHKGLPTVLTSYNYIAGEHPSEAELTAYLENRGWRVVDENAKSKYYMHKSGVEVIDAHTKNFIKTTDQKIYPVDVHFRGKSAEKVLKAKAQKPLLASK
jgi:hypothetical protein